MTSGQRRVAAVAVLSTVIVLALALVVFTERQDAAQTVTVWELTHDVPAGAQYSMNDVEAMQIHAPQGQFTYEASGPDALAARYAVALSAHDIITPDDLTADSAESEVAINIADPPPIAVGDRIDVYATLAGGAEALIGRGMLVDSIDGGSFTVLVPVQDEASWIAVSASGVSLHAARTVPGGSIAPDPLSSSDAIRILCGPVCAGLDVSATPPS